jgi:hypothetical protein
MPTAKTAAKKTAKSPKKPASKAAKTVTLADVWATIDRIGKAHEDLEKAQKETHEAMKEVQKAIKDTQEAHKETEKAIKNTQRNIDGLSISHKETEKAIKDTQRNIGGLNNTMGSLVERVMTLDLPRKFKPFGFTFGRITTIKWTDDDNNIYAEIDGLLENGSQAMVVEVKTTLRREDVDDHLKRMEKVRIYADDHGDKREFLGAMAAAIIDKDTKRYALSKGFFVIEPSGEDVIVTKPVSDPAVW